MTTSAPLSCAIHLSATLSSQDEQLLAQFLPQLPVTKADDADTLPIVAVVDGRGLACPLPLLKTKVALRSVQVGEALYVIATDPNSTADIAAFCRQSGAKALSNTASAHLELCLQYQSNGESINTAIDDNAEQDAVLTNNAVKNRAADTFFHFIITKTDSN